MILEALRKHLISGSQPARKLKENPQVIKSLSDYNQAVRQISRVGVRIRAITPAIVKASEIVRAQEGLMTNDSVTVVLMHRMGLTSIATHDSDFERIPGIMTYQPEDIP
jgi:predicted nucleic acid-binding protein